MLLTLLDQTFAVHQLAPNAEVPALALESPFFAITRTNEELSLVLPEEVEIESEKSVGGWVCFKVEGPLEFGLVGILAGISSALAAQKVPIFALSTFDTDYVLVKREQVRAAHEALSSAGYNVEDQ
jgi:uncharacterized protein